MCGNRCPVLWSWALVSWALVSWAAGPVCRAGDPIALVRRIYTNQRACAVGDLLTVVIEEKASASKTEGTATSKTAAASATEGVLGGAQNSGRWENITTILPPYTLGGNTTFEGEGSAESQQNLSAAVTARVMDVLPNRVLVVRGERLVEMRGETVTMVLTGLVRQSDVAHDNTVPSTKLSDARIFYETDGEVSRGSRSGWLWKLLQTVNPL
jgi:flagellar L-ring protein precursor FlgH